MPYTVYFKERVLKKMSTTLVRSVNNSLLKTMIIDTFNWKEPFSD